MVSDPKYNLKLKAKGHILYYIRRHGERLYYKEVMTASEIEIM